MQWLLVVMISLWWCEVDAIKGLNATECRRNMFDDWHDKNRRAYTLQKADTDYLQNIDIGERADAPAGMRQECRTMSDEKRNVLWGCFRWLFTTRETPNGPTRYQIFMAQHRQSVAPSAHFGPCFPPWHREFLLRLERALQQCNREVNLCYWDSTLDNPLPDAAHSCLWTPEYFGNGQGPVTTGFAANLQAFPPDCAATWPRLSRSCRGNSLLMNRNKINNLYRDAFSYNRLMTPYDSNNFEGYHGEVHGFVGGHMSIISCAVTDPVFWLHHCFIDYVWENCRRRQRGNIQLEYPINGPIPRDHRGTDTMQPFLGTTCRGGLSNRYIPGTYRYVDSPGACTTHAECGGKALWCYNGACTACVGPNGRMGADWPDNGCYITNCPTPRKVNNVCTCAT